MVLSAFEDNSTRKPLAFYPQGRSDFNLCPYLEQKGGKAELLALTFCEAFGATGTKMNLTVWWREGGQILNKQANGQRQCRGQGPERP